MTIQVDRREYTSITTKGTFYEIDKDGNKSTRIVGDNYEVVASDFVNIKGTANSYNRLQL